MSRVVVYITHIIIARSGGVNLNKYAKQDHNTRPGNYEGSLILADSISKRQNQPNNEKHKQ